MKVIGHRSVAQFHPPGRASSIFPKLCICTTLHERHIDVFDKGSTFLSNATKVSDKRPFSTTRNFSLSFFCLRTHKQRKIPLRAKKIRQVKAAFKPTFHLATLFARSEAQTRIQQVENRL